MKGIIRIVRDGEVKLTLPGQSVTIKGDGSIWYQGTPVLGLTDPAEKKSAVAAIKAGKYEYIPASAYTRLGNNPNGLWAGDDEAWERHPAKLAADKIEESKRIEEAKIVTIYLSSRGWGDYSSCNWSGDITRPDTEILAECKHNLATEHDVDKPNQTNEQLLGLIHAARAKWAAPKTPRLEPNYGPGYCYSCESYCYGDCGNYNTSPAIKYRRETKEAAAEENYGIND